MFDGYVFPCILECLIHVNDDRRALRRQTLPDLRQHPTGLESIWTSHNDEVSAHAHASSRARPQILPSNIHLSIEERLEMGLLQTLCKPIRVVRPIFMGVGDEEIEAKQQIYQTS